MKRILGIAMMLSLVGALSVIAQEVKPGKIEVFDLGKDVKLEMVLIPAGKFMMGDPRKNYEVTLTKPFYIGKYEVTQDQWEEVMGKNPSRISGAKLPVTQVSWNDCQGFIKKLNAKTDSVFRLPTEAEWEYACRAGTTTAYSFGDKITLQDANYADSKMGKPVAVGSYKPNAFGLYDMHGNVWEWCEDYWLLFYPKFAFPTDPKGPPIRGPNHVLGGGSFDSNALMARSSYRYNDHPTLRFVSYGFRLAKTP